MDGNWQQWAMFGWGAACGLGVGILIGIAWAREKFAPLRTALIELATIAAEIPWPLGKRAEMLSVIRRAREALGWSLPTC